MSNWPGEASPPSACIDSVLRTVQTAAKIIEMGRRHSQTFDPAASQSVTWAATGYHCVRCIGLPSVL